LTVAVALLAVQAANAGDRPGAVAKQAVETSNASAARAEGSPNQPPVTSAEELVKLVAQRKLWPLKADAAEEQLRALGPWKREQPIPEALTLVAGRAGIVARSEISYAADAKKRWIFVGASFFVADADLGQLHRTLSEVIEKQLGKPRWTRKAADRPAAGWKLGKHLELLLTHSPVEGERLLALMISEPQGASAD
jgi:hypothetical protein